MTYFALPSAQRLTLPRWLPLTAIFALAAALRFVVVANADVAWGLTMAQKWLDGAQLYVDVIEVNPPATVFLYVLPVVVERLSGIRAEFFVDALVFLAAGLSLWIAGRLWRLSSADPRQARLLSILMAAALLILPAQTFGEREQIALICFVPLLAIAALRGGRKSPGWPMAIAAGIGGGLVTIIKPHFAVAIVLVSAVAAYQARSWRPIFAAENWIAAAMALAYAAFVAVAYPHFFSDVFPLLSLVYLPAKENLLSFLLRVATPLWAVMLLLIARLLGWRALKSPFSFLLAGSIGFSVAYYVQQKGWPYQSYPMLALGLVALVLAVVENWRDGVDAPGSGAWKPMGIATLAIAAVTFTWMDVAIDRSALAGPIRAIKAQPRILALSPDLSIGHPITRQVQGTWVSRVSAQWMTLGAAIRSETETLDPATQAKLADCIALDRRLLTEDIVRGRPDVILVQIMETIDWLAWARQDPALADALKPYRPDRTVGDVLILRRIGGS